MSQLRTYHSLIRSVRHEESVYAADLICDEQGRPRWRDFASGIEAINRLRALIKIPDRLKQVLTTEGMIDRGALDVATQNLEDRLNRSGTSGQRSRPTACAHRHWNGQDKLCGCLSHGFQEWLQNMESAVRQRVAKLESLAATLEVDQDVALSDLPRCLAQVEEIRRLQGRQSDLRCELDRIIDRRSPIDAAILEPFVATARNVTRFLDTYGDSPRGTLLEVITRSEARRSLESACSTLASVLDQLGVHVGSLGQRLALTDPGAGQTGYADVSSTGFQSWLQDIESALRQEGG